MNKFRNNFQDCIFFKSGLVNYCDESLLKDWRQWDRANKIENCRLAMSMAYEKLNIPLVVTPENMSSPELDELSSITYISYFMKEDSPGYLKTLNIIQNLLPDEKITNFNVSSLSFFKQTFLKHI